MNLTLQDASAVAGAIAIDGSTVRVSLAPGQTGRLSFDGTQAERVALSHQSEADPVGYCAVSVSIANPDGSTLASTCADGNTVGYIGATSLPQTGSYTVILSSHAPNVATVDVALSDAE